MDYSSAHAAANSVLAVITCSYVPVWVTKAGNHSKSDVKRKCRCRGGSRTVSRKSGGGGGGVNKIVQSQSSGG